jgi:hypothetical protein
LVSYSSFRRTSGATYLPVTYLTPVDIEGKNEKKKRRQRWHQSSTNFNTINNNIHLQALPGEVTAFSSLTFLLHFSILHKSKSATFKCPVSSLNMFLLSYTMRHRNSFNKPGILKHLMGCTEKRHKQFSMPKKGNTKYSRRLKVTMNDSLRLMLM